MTLSIYNIIWWVLRPILPLVLGWRQHKGKEQAGRRQDRYGQPHFNSRLSGVIWLHSVKNSWWKIGVKFCGGVVELFEKL